MRLPVYDERNGAFARLRERRVLIYWPHGLGDFVHFGHVVPMLEPSNEYFITRYGDDFVHLYDGAEGIAPLYSGAMPIGDGGALGARHLGIDFRRIRNREEDVTIAEPLRSRVVEHGIDAILYTDYPECEGRTRFPFHTKARALARELVLPERLAQFDLSHPLGNALRFDVPPDARARIEERIRTLAGPGERLYVISPGGHTNVEKTWPQADVNTFVALLEQRDASARAFVVNERNVAERFGDLQLPFAYVLVTLLRAAHAFVGVPSGPLHAAIALGASPVVGIWLSRYPDWYDEPHPNVTHLVGPIPYKKRYDRRIGSTSLPPTLHHDIVAFRDRAPTPNDVLGALREF